MDLDWITINITTIMNASCFRSTKLRKMLLISRCSKIDDFEVVEEVRVSVLHMIHSGLIYVSWFDLEYEHGLVVQT